MRIKERGMKLNGKHLGVITAIGIPIYWPRGIVPFTGHILLITPGFRTDTPDNPFSAHMVSFWKGRQREISLSIYERPGWILSDNDEDYIHYDNFHNLEDFIVFLEKKWIYS